MSYEAYDIERFELSDEGQLDLHIHNQLSELRQLYASFVEKPVSKYAQPLSEASTRHLNSVRNVLEKLDDGTWTEKNISGVIKYAKGLEINRVTCLNEVDPDEENPYVVAQVYDRLNDYILNLNVDELDQDERQELDSITISEVIFDKYDEMFRTDITTLSTKIVHEYAEKPSTKRKEMLMKVGRHALDVVKAGVGAAAAIAIAKKFKIL